MQRSSQKVRLVDKVRLIMYLKKRVKVKHNKISIGLGEDCVELSGDRCKVRFSTLNLREVQYIIKMLCQNELEHLKYDKRRVDITAEESSYENGDYRYALRCEKGVYELEYEGVSGLVGLC